jgi:hypothetical protein
MSLTVHARRKATDSRDEEAVWMTPAPPHNELAGFEAWRTSVWGSGVVRRLGLRILPALAQGDLRASGQLLNELDAEVKRLQESLRVVVAELLDEGVHIVANDDPYETIRFRLANIAEAVRLAQAIPDGAGEVVIW